MSSIEERGESFERKFALDEELRFKAEARRNKLLGLWAAEKMAHSNPDAYAKEVILADFEEAGDDDVFRRVKADFEAHNVSVSDEELKQKMQELLAVAVEQIQNT